MDGVGQTEKLTLKDRKIEGVGWKDGVGWIDEVG